MQPERYHSLPSISYIFMRDEQNKKIDILLQMRQDGMYNYSRATKELLAMGVKTGKQSTGAITIPNSYQPYLKKFNLSNLEFEWEINYTDGSVLRQFENEKQHDFSDIDRTKLKNITYISNFTWPTDNQEKRIIVRLNWETGKFEFMNGFAPQDVKAKCCIKPLEGEKKLILLSKKRISGATGQAKGELQEFVNMIDEFFFYNRFILGYQVPSGEKMAVIIEPNGNIKLFEN